MLYLGSEPSIKIRHFSSTDILEKTLEKLVKKTLADTNWRLMTDGIHYTEVGVLFGKFWLGEEEDSKAGIPIPPPPYHILSIRSAIIKRDPKFFQKAPGLLGDLLESDDDGRDVMEISQFLGRRPVCTWTSNDVRDALRVLQDSGMYETMKGKAKKEMEARS